MGAADEIQGYSAAAELVNKRMSPRARKLAALERWVDGSQYDGKRGWDEDCPIAEKAPCIVEPVVANSIESHVDMVLGEGRFPVITTRPAEDDDDKGSDPEDDEGGLSEDDSAAVDRLILGIIEEVRFQAVCREALTLAMGSGSVAAIYGAREGRLVGDTVKARWCTPEFMPNGRDVKRLVIEYPYIDTFQDAGGVWKARARIYRREIDDTKDVTMAPAEADVMVPKWTPAETLEHGFGFCPVVWYPFMRGCSIVGQIDGNAPHARLTDEVYAHDVAVSQRHRAALYAGDPQWSETGVEAGTNPSSGGKATPLRMTENGGRASDDNPVTGQIETGSTNSGARKKHPGTVWQYEDKDTKVTLHTLPGDALKALTEHADDLRQKLLHALAFVPLDNANASIVRGPMSGKALDLLKERQTHRDDKIRDDFGDRFLKPSIQILMRIVHAEPAMLRTRGMRKAMPILKRFGAGVPDAVA